MFPTLPTIFNPYSSLPQPCIHRRRRSGHASSLDWRLTSHPIFWLRREGALVPNARKNSRTYWLEILHRANLAQPGFLGYSIYFAKDLDPKNQINKWPIYCGESSKIVTLGSLLGHQVDIIYLAYTNGAGGKSIYGWYPMNVFLYGDIVYLIHTPGAWMVWTKYEGIYQWVTSTRVPQTWSFMSLFVVLKYT